MLAAGLPIVGDAAYARDVESPRMMLHALSLHLDFEGLQRLSLHDFRMRGQVPPTVAAAVGYGGATPRSGLHEDAPTAAAAVPPPSPPFALGGALFCVTQDPFLPGAPLMDGLALDAADVHAGRVMAAFALTPPPYGSAT